ncbi:MAG: hypothetical protein H6Q89_5683 [Myxococcaceae bacterium]|nr:hypothetical protein [Myxococcaceae bacterium]
MKNLRLVPMLSVFLVLSTCSGVNGMGQLLIDAGVVLADAGNGNAQTAPRTLTADTDASRLESGALIGTTTASTLVSGPIVITMLSSSDGAISLAWLLPEATACDAAPTGTASFRLRQSSVLTGFFVKQGQKLCVFSAGADTLLWAGYRPY